MEVSCLAWVIARVPPSRRNPRVGKGQDDEEGLLWALGAPFEREPSPRRAARGFGRSDPCARTGTTGFRAGWPGSRGSHGSVPRRMDPCVGLWRIGRSAFHANFIRPCRLSTW